MYKVIRSLAPGREKNVIKTGGQESLGLFSFGRGHERERQRKEKEGEEKRMRFRERFLPAVTKFDFAHLLLPT